MCNDCLGLLKHRVAAEELIDYLKEDTVERVNFINKYLAGARISFDGEEFTTDELEHIFLEVNV